MEYELRAKSESEPENSTGPQSAPPAGIEEFLAPVSVETFLSQHWLRRPLHVPGSPEKLARLLGRTLQLPQLLEMITRPARTPVTMAAFFQSRGQEAWRDAADELPRMDVHPDQIPALLAAGATVAAYGVDSIEPLFARCAALLRTRLGHAGRTSCSLWMSSPSRGMYTHFDTFSSIHVQLVGSKVWLVSPEVQVLAPATASSVRSDGTADVDVTGFSPRYERVDRNSFRRFAMRPGDVLFVPSGAWHDTESDSAAVSVSCSFEFFHTSFRALVAAHLAERFGAEELWRHVPLAPPGNEAAEEELNTFFARRLEETIAALMRLRGDTSELTKSWKQLIANNGVIDLRQRAAAPSSATVEPTDILAAPPGKPITCAFGKKDGAEAPALFLYQDGRTARVHDRGFFVFGQKLAGASAQAFNARAACSWKEDGTYEWSEVKPVLEALVARGMLRVEKPGQSSLCNGSPGERGDGMELEKKQ